MTAKRRRRTACEERQQLSILLDANTSLTDVGSLASDMAHLELFSDFVRRPHVHHTSDFFHATRPLLVVVRVSRFS